MTHKTLALCAAALMALPATAQTAETADASMPHKWSAMLRPVVKRATEAATLSRSVDGTAANASVADTLLTLSVRAGDTDAALSYLRAEGYEATSITDGYVITTIPARLVPTIAEHESIAYINAPRKMQPMMNHVREENGVAKVQAGEGLDTPFDGSGVIVGVIDAGFQYDHAAFKDRVVRYGTNAGTGALSALRPTKDETDDVGHATHVTNIAAGSPVGNSPYYGIATGADLIMMKSDLYTSSIMLQAAAIRDYAKAKGQPWVINMSFGGVIGPHDGTTDTDQTLSSLTTTGGFLVAAMGNTGGEKIHAQRTFTSDDETIYLYMKADADETDPAFYSCVYSTSTDGSTPLTITPVLYYNNKEYELTASVLDQAEASYAAGVDDANGRQTAIIYVDDLAAVKTALGINSRSTAYLLWRVKGKTGASFHAWISANYGATFGSLRRTGITATAGDDSYDVGEGSATVPTAIAVASYNNTTLSFPSIDGNEYEYPETTMGKASAMSTFSSKGPYLGTQAKPTISATGGCVISAISKKSDSFSKTNTNNVGVYSGNYYGIKSGTSMATPVVTGIIALWLQANPELTYDQLISVLASTGRRDDTTGEADASGWNAKAGYGKIDAYEGLKQVLLLKDGINDVVGSAAPLTFNRTGDAYKILFNNDERRADIRLVAASGRTVRTLRLTSPRRGEEHVVDLSTLAPGVYVLQAETDGAVLNKKVVVK